MTLGPHAFYIIASYAVTALIVGGLILRAMRDQRAQARALSELEGRGVRRRSSAASSPPSHDGAPGGQAVASRSGA